MTLFDAYLVVDWSARNGPLPAKPVADAVWVGQRVNGDPTSKEYFAQTRWDCEDFLRTRLIDYRNAGKRVFIGFDFPYGYPTGYATAIGLKGNVPPWRFVWDELRNRIKDDENGFSNRFAVASDLNAVCGDAEPGPLWGCPPTYETASLWSKSLTFPYHLDGCTTLERWRRTETVLPGVSPVWKLFGPGSVGSQALLGIPVVARLRDDSELQQVSQVWPFETGLALPVIPPGRPFILHAEIWPGVVKGMIDPASGIKDQLQVRAMVEWLAERDAVNKLLPFFSAPASFSAADLANIVNEEGWIFGAA